MPSHCLGITTQTRRHFNFVYYQHKFMMLTSQEPNMTTSLATWQIVWNFGKAHPVAVPVPQTKALSQYSSCASLKSRLEILSHLFSEETTVSVSLAFSALCLQRKGSETQCDLQHRGKKSKKKSKKKVKNYCFKFKFGLVLPVCLASMYQSTKSQIINW